MSPISPAGKKVIIAGYAKSSFTILGSIFGNASCMDCMSGNIIRLANAIRIHGHGRKA